MQPTTPNQIPPAPAVLGALGSIEDGIRRAGYQAFMDFYEGRQWTTRPRRTTDTRTTVNYARPMVRKAVSYSLAEPVTHSIPKTATLSEEAAQLAERSLNDALAGAGANDLDAQLLTDASVYGDAALKVTWDHDVGALSLAAVHPNELLIWTDPRSPNEPIRAVHGYYLQGLSIAKHFGLPKSIEAGASTRELYPVLEDWTADTWSVTVNGWPVLAIKNPYGFVPYVPLINEPATGRQWGTSDLVDMIDICRELNKRISTLGDILNLSGAPIAVLENVSGTEGIEAAPGAKWELPEGAKAYLLDLLAGGGVQLHIDTINTLKTQLHDIAETPKSAFGDSGRALSGVAIAFDIQPLTQKVKRKRRALDRFYRARNRRVLSLLQQFGGAPVSADMITLPIYPPILPSDEEAMAKTAAMLVGSGIKSRRTASAELGVADPEEELKRVIEENELMALPTTTQEDEETNPDGTEASVRESDDPGQSDRS